MSDAGVLRDMREDDLPTLFEHQQDPEARHMAAFTPKDAAESDAFLERWRKIMADPATVCCTVEADGSVAGLVVGFERDGEAEVTYWLGRPYWGRGLATAALRRFLEVYPPRPLHARAAGDNVASIRVLEKCGFVVIERETSFANARGAEIQEVVLRLD